MKKYFIHILGIILSIILLCAAFFSGYTQNTNYPVGSIEGLIDVSATGAATYSIPIEIVPGTQGVQPNLAVVYNSQGGMGILGMKWSLSGLSAISRTPQTLYHDGKQTAVDLTANDRFSLDGNRLISSTTYWAINNPPIQFYKSEMENFDFIEAHGVQGNGPLYFKIFSDNGTIIEYGNTPDSRQMLKPAGNSDSTVLNWMINKITDVEGNYMTFTYEKSENEIWIRRISYTGNDKSGGTAPYAEVIFVYSLDNTHYGSAFVAGNEIKQTRLLEAIVAGHHLYNAPAMECLNSYKFGYDNNNPPRLTSITEYGVACGSGQPLNPTIIDWGEAGDSDFSGGTPKNVSNLDLDLEPEITYLTGDFNGDGKTDLIKIYIQNYFPFWNIYHYNADNNTFTAGSSGAGNAGERFYFVVLDINGDGKDELIIEREVINGSLREAIIEVVRFSGSTFSLTTLCTIPNTKVISERVASDFRGTGKQELFLSFFDKTVRIIGENENGSVYLSNYFWVKDATITLLNFNGDNKTNLYQNDGTKYYIYGLSETNVWGVIHEASAAGLPLTPSGVGDFNGDGISDLLWKSGSSYAIALGTGKGFRSTVTKGFNYSYNLPPIICDLNGDGKDDLIYFNTHTVLGATRYSAFNYYLSTGFYNDTLEFIANNALPLTTAPHYSAPKRCLLGNFKGNHKYTLLTLKHESSSVNAPVQSTLFSFTQDDQFHFVTQLTDGMGCFSKITYTSSYVLTKTSFNPVRERFLHYYFPSKVDVFNINTYDTYQYTFTNPVYSRERLQFLGFKSFSASDNRRNFSSVQNFEMTGAVNLLRPVSTSIYKNGTLIKNISYRFSSTQICRLQQSGIYILQCQTNRDRVFLKKC